MRTSTLFACALSLAAAACADPQGAATPSSATPRVAGLSASQVVVGETVEFYGRGFLHGDEGTTRLRFAGDFHAEDGQLLPVDFTITPFFGGRDEGEDQDILTWSRFGPFANPFTGDARGGTFSGRITPVTQAEDGTLTTGEPLKVDLTVGPSIIIEQLEPIEARCGIPAARALAGVPYRLRVRVGGIKATRFVFEVAEVNGADGASRFEHDFGRHNPVAVDELGVDRALIFNPIPDDRQFYVAALRVLAYDDEGNSVETALPVTVHRPIEVSYDGSYELAERYEPEPVSGCIPGSINSVVEYTETHTEARQNSVSVTFATEWTQGKGRTVSQTMLEGMQTGTSHSRSMGETDWEGQSLEEGYGLSYSRAESNDVNYSSTDGERWSWNMSEGESNEDYTARMNMLFGEGSVSGTVGVEAEGSVPGFAKVAGSVSTTAGVTAGASTTGTRGNSHAVSTNRGYGMAGSSEESRSFGSTVADERSQNVSGNFVLSNSRSRTEEDTEARRESHTWSLSDGLSQSEATSEGMSHAEAQTWVTSEAIATTQGFVGSIPRTKVGIFYRQTTRWVRRAEVRSYDLCGVATHMGELQFNEWTWAPNLAIGDSCEVVPPPPELPTARCFVPPCGG